MISKTMCSILFFYTNTYSEKKLFNSCEDHSCEEDKDVENSNFTAMEDLVNIKIEEYQENSSKKILF